MEQKLLSTAWLRAVLVSNPKDGVKILGNGELTKKLTVKVTAVSEGAKAKIEAAGGTVEVILYVKDSSECIQSEGNVRQRSFSMC